MTQDVFLDLPPDVGQRIRALWVWVAIYEDGSEGIISHGFAGVGQMPLMSSKKQTAEKLHRVAMQAAVMASSGSKPLRCVELRGFSAGSTAGGKG